jgi:hypothetical protein
MEYKLKLLLVELENKKKEIEKYLLEIDNKIKIIKSEIYNKEDIICDQSAKFTKSELVNIDKNVINKERNNQQVTNEYEYSGDEYDSDDSMDRLYLMDLPKLFE